MSKRRFPPLTFIPAYWTLRDRYEYGMTKWEDGLADTYAVRSEIDRAKRALLKVIKLDPFWVEEFILWAIEQHDKSLDAARKIFGENLRKKSSQELATLLSELFRGQVYGRAIIYLEIDTQIQNDLERFLIKKNKDKKDLTRTVQILTSSLRMSAEMKKRLEFLKMLGRFQKKGMTPSLKKEINELVDKYGWIGVSTGGKALNATEVELTLRKEKKLNPRRETRKILNRYERLKKEKEVLTAKYELTPILKRCTDYLSESAYLRQYRKETTDMMVRFTAPLYKEISRRLSLPMGELLFLWPNQVEEGLKGNLDKGRLKTLSAEQKKFSIVVFEKGEISQLSGAEARKYFSRQVTGEGKSVGKVSYLHGRSVYIGKGKVKGIVRVVIGPSEFKKVNKGDILVATQTPPEFTPVIAKAGAVVIDEGGVTSHAGLLCREFQVPGIIGTKVATKVLRDGDLVEVDAEKGIVKILKKAK